MGQEQPDKNQTKKLGKVAAAAACFGIGAALPIVVIGSPVIAVIAAAMAGFAVNGALITATGSTIATIAGITAGATAAVAAGATTFFGGIIGLNAADNALEKRGVPNAVYTTSGFLGYLLSTTISIPSFFLGMCSWADHMEASERAVNEEAPKTSEVRSPATMNKGSLALTSQISDILNKSARAENNNVDYSIVLPAASAKKTPAMKLC